MMWEPKKVMNNQSMNALEAGISRLQPWGASKGQNYGWGRMLPLYIGT
jgi:hypothetical protein